MSKDRLLFRWREALMSPAGPRATVRHVLLTLSTDADGDGGNCYPSTRRLAERTALSRRAVEGQLREAEAVGWIRRQARGEGQGWRRMSYTLSIPEAANVGNDVPRVGPEGGERGSPRPSQKVGHDVPHDSAERGEPHARRGEPHDQNVGNDVPLISVVTSVETSLSVDGDTGDRRDFPPLDKLPRHGRERIYPREFEGAFDALPKRHVSHPKADAYRAWRQRTRDVAELFQLEAAADAYRERAEADGNAGTKYVMEAATFFGPGLRFEPYLGVEPVKASAPGFGAFVDRSVLGAA